MKLRVKKSYKTKYNNPIVLKPGDEVLLGEEEKEDKWKGWIWATSNNVSGWIPLQIIKDISHSGGTIMENYSAKELDVEKGDTIYVHKELNGWYWARNLKTNEEGWIPKEITV